MRVFTMALTMVLGGGAFLAHHAQAQDTELTRADRAAEVALSDEALQLRYFTQGEVVGVEEGRLFGGIFMSEDRDVVGSAALVVPINARLGDRFTVELGPQLYMALLSDDENSDVFAISAGLQLRYEVIRQRQMELVGSAFYSPDVLTFGSADNLTDLEARVEMRLTDQVIGMAGARWFELDLLLDEERKLQDELFVGVRWEFE